MATIEGILASLPHGVGVKLILIMFCFLGSGSSILGDVKNNLDNQSGKHEIISKGIWIHRYLKQTIFVIRTLCFNQNSDLPYGGYWIPFEKSESNSNVMVPKSSTVNIDSQL